MPVYGYRCSRGHHFELLQRITEPPVSQCPECQAPATRVFYPVGIIFKGQGFYKTDSRPSSDGSGTESASKPAETKAPDSKPAESKSTDSKSASSSSSSETAKSA
jgi:putative FmdB family regulatory protein